MSAEITKTEVTLPIQELKNLVSQVRDKGPRLSADEDWCDAAITCAFSFDLTPGTGSADGWISYYDGTKVYYKLTEVTSKGGIAAGIAALPWVTVKPWETFCGKDVQVEINGALFGGEMTLTCDGQSIGPVISLLSVAPAGYELVGKMSFTKS
jgi:hypothetical protein